MFLREAGCFCWSGALGGQVGAEKLEGKSSCGHLLLPVYHHQKCVLGTVLIYSLEAQVSSLFSDLSRCQTSYSLVFNGQSHSSAAAFLAGVGM